MSEVSFWLGTAKCVQWLNILMKYEWISISYFFCDENMEKNDILILYISLGQITGLSRQIVMIMDNSTIANIYVGKLNKKSFLSRPITSAWPQ